MTFPQQIIATVIGSIGGFIFSIALFYFTEKRKNKKQEDNLLKNIIKECDFNISMLENIIEEFEKTIKKIAINDKQLYNIFRFDQLQKIFILKALEEGVLYKILQPTTIKTIFEMINTYSSTYNEIYYKYCDSYKEEKMSNIELTSRLEYRKDELRGYIKLNQELKENMQKINN